MGVPTSEVGYTSAMPRREDHEVRKGHVGHWIKKKTCIVTFQSAIYWDATPNNLEHLFAALRGDCYLYLQFARTA